MLCSSLAFVIFFLDLGTSGVLGSILDQKYGMLGLPAKPEGESSQVVEDWFEQRLDHFDRQNNAKWRQRFLYNLDHYDPTRSSPIFLLLGGEHEIHWSWLTSGQIASNYAPASGAGLVYLEHRYYGQSRPTANMSLPNLSYLSSEQALQDVANFVEFFNRKFHLVAKNKWIVFGSFYAGSLAAWTRLKFPHLVSGAVASSAPVKAIVDFQDYFVSVSRTLGDECSENIRQATAEIQSRLYNSAGIEEITGKFRLCDRLDKDNDLDVSSFMLHLATNFGDTVQSSTSGFHKLCRIMNDTSLGSPLDRYARVNSMIHGSKCLTTDYNQGLFAEVSWNKTTPWARLWRYQTCTEFGYFRSSNSPDQPFGNFFPVELFSQQCVDLFGRSFDRGFVEGGVAKTNNLYGDTDIRASNVVFVNGRLDPWHSLGVLKETEHMEQNDVQVVIIEDASHCADWYPSQVNDSIALKLARKTILDTIQRFIQ